MISCVSLNPSIDRTLALERFEQGYYADEDVERLKQALGQMQR